MKRNFISMRAFNNYALPIDEPYVQKEMKRIAPIGSVRERESMIRDIKKLSGIVSLRLYIYTYIHTYIHTYMHAYIQPIHETFLYFYESIQ